MTQRDKTTGGDEMPDVRLIATESGIMMYEAPHGVKITAMTEHSGNLYVALNHAGGKNELMIFDLTDISARTQSGDAGGIEKAYEEAVALSGKKYARVKFEYDGRSYTVEPTRLARKIHELTRPRVEAPQIEGLDEAIKYFDEFVRVQDRKEPYYVRQSEAHNLMAIIQAAKAYRELQK